MAGGRIYGLGVLYTPEEVAWAHNRPPAHRPPKPRAGDRVLYRPNDWFPVEPAMVTDVFWECENGTDNWADLALPDPWPMVRLEIKRTPIAAKLDGSGLLLPGAAAPDTELKDTWESRMDGQCGWLPLDWERWPRPASPRRRMGAVT